ncbi:MAG: peptidyl-tRNA hydrolase, family [Eubacteriales bacterium]|nr:peptidyl-tRNA hydrolase, family [Eubacteriales bacterium]MDN5364114.1 peptidyl-tRNA hydrolase, family [Eubacteriales bacterium]
MKIIAGLGNPGREYENTRHNIGFMVVDELARFLGLAFCGEKFCALVAEGLVDGEKVLLLKPQTYMNLSGLSVAEAARFYKLEPAAILVVYDDMDLPPGKIRLREKGSSGGHKGMQSVIDHLGTDAIPRLRIGIGRGPGQGADYVLSPFREEEKPIIEEAVRRGAEALTCWLKEGMAAAMNKYNR